MDAHSLPLFDDPAPATDTADGDAERAPLRPLYYLHNFRVAMESLRDRYADLLSAEESHFIRTFVRLPEAPQCLFTRLAMRKGPFFRRASLRYPEIPGIEQALEVLSYQGLVELDPAVEVAALPEVLNKAELRWIFGAASSRARSALPQSTRDQLALPIDSPSAETRCLSRWHPALADRFVKLTVDGVVQRLQWLFFGNDHQDWTEFVLTDLGAVRYERVPTDGDGRAFQSRDEIEHFYRLNECRARLQTEESAAAICEAVHRPVTACSWLQDRFMRLHLQLGERLESEGEPDLAIRLYQDTGGTEGQVRAVQLLERLGRHEAARADALAIPAQSCTEAQRVILDRILIRMTRRLDKTVVPHRLRNPADTLELRLSQPAEERIERVVAAAMSTEEAPAFYVENGLLTSLFGLWSWEALYAPLPGAFFHAYQSGPADLHTAEFRERRREKFDALFALFETGGHEALIRRHYRAKAGVWTKFVRWRRLKPQLLAHALHCIPAEHLKRCFDRMLDNLDDNTAGLPDLIQFWPAERRYRMIEVKAPGDRLQDNQRRWLAFFAENQMPAAVCKVSWVGLGLK